MKIFFFTCACVCARARATEFLFPYQRDIVVFVSLFLEMEEIRNL